MKEQAIEIVPTIVPASFADVEEVSKKYAKFSSFFQIDVADGKFAPNTTWLPKEGDTLPHKYGYEVHCMVADPYSVGSVFAHAGAHTLIAHVEALGDSERAKQVCGEWRGSGVKQIGLAILFQTPLEDVEQYLPYFDFVLLMTIPRIGVQGIPYEKSAPARVADFHTRYPEISIAVDGGVSEGNIADLTHAGARHFGVGSAIAKAADPAAAYTKLLSLAEAAIV